MTTKRKAPAAGSGAGRNNNDASDITDFIGGCQDTSAEAQRRTVHSRLQCGPTTTLQFRSMGIMHPGMRICELRQQGHEIRTEWATEYCPGGVLHRVARYRLVDGESFNG